MTGREEEEYEAHDFAPVPHPDDRLWRHPAEMAAIAAAHASAETAKVPVIKINTPPSARRMNLGLLAAAGVIFVGATALTIGVLSARPSATNTAAATSFEAFDTPVAGVGIGIAGGDSSPDSLADELHAELALSLPRVQAATASGMREGSGIFVTSTGHIVTSAGLVADAKYLVVWTDDSRRWEASLVAADPASDIAVLQIASQAWPAASIGVDRVLRSGQYAMAIDHQAKTMTIGQVDSIADDPREPHARIEISDTNALPGSAIVDDGGFVIGMSTFGHSAQATPAWLIDRVALELITTGDTSYSWLLSDVDLTPLMSMREIETMPGAEGLF